MTRKILLMLSVCALIAATSHAGQFGAVSPVAQVGQISQEIGFFSSRGEWKAEDRDFEDAEIVQNQFYIQAGYGLSENWESYFRIGAADFKIKDPVPDEFAGDEDFDMEDDPQLFAALGIRGIFYRGSFFNLGAFVQGNYFSGYEDSKTAPVAGVATELELEFDDHWDVSTGAAIEAELGEVGFYAGPVLYLSRGKLELEAKAIGITETRSSTYEERGYLGAVAGITLPVAGFGKLYVEGQYRNKVSAGGAFVYLRHNY